MNWWNTLTELQQIFASVAIPSTVIMVIQLVLLLAGLGDNGVGDGADMPDDMDFHGELSDSIPDAVHADFDTGAHESMEDTGDSHDHAKTICLFSLRGIVAFFTIGGWMGIVAVDWGFPVHWAIILALGAGWLALFFVAWSISAILRLQQNGNVQLTNAIGKTGRVYIPVSENGAGKINIVLHERLCEINAMTKVGRVLKTGEKVVVTGISPERALLVVPANSPEEVNNALKN